MATSIPFGQHSIYRERDPVRGYQWASPAANKDTRRQKDKQEQEQDHATNTSNGQVLVSTGAGLRASHGPFGASRCRRAVRGGSRTRAVDPVDRQASRSNSWPLESPASPTAPACSSAHPAHPRRHNLVQMNMSRCWFLLRLKRRVSCLMFCIFSL